VQTVNTEEISARVDPKFCQKKTRLGSAVHSTAQPTHFCFSEELFNAKVNRCRVKDLNIKTDEITSFGASEERISS
jgi:hypothetical protein